MIHRDICKPGFTKLVKRENFNNNTEVLRENRGLLTVGRHTRTEHKPSDSLPCESCQRWFLIKHLHRHYSVCISRNLDSPQANTLPKRGHAVALAQMYLDGAVSGEVSKEFKLNILTSLHQDDRSKIVKNDMLILKFGESQYRRYGTNRSHDIRQRMRQLARLLQKVNSLRPVNPVLQCQL